MWNHTEDCHIYWFDVLWLLRSNHGEFCNLGVFLNEIWWFRCIGHSNCYPLVDDCRHRVGNQQACCFRKLLQWCHGPRCVPFRGMVNKGCDCFCCCWWYGQVFVHDDWLWFGGCLTWGCLTCIVKWGKCIRPCVVSMTTLLFLIKCNPIIGPVSFFITTKCSAKELSPISTFSLAVDIGFSNWPFATCILKLGGSSLLRSYLGLSVLWFPSHPGQLRWQMLLSPPERLPSDYS